MPVTVIDSFNQALPDAPFHERRDPNPRAHISGNSTASAEAPFFAFRVSLEDWLPFAQKILDKQTIRDALSDHSLATWEPSRNFIAEADVAHASTLQFTNPVDLALSASHSTQIRFSDDASATGRVRSRGDRVWAARINNG